MNDEHGRALNRRLLMSRIIDFHQTIQNCCNEDELKCEMSRLKMKFDKHSKP